MIWNSLDDFFTYINHNVEYVILRNWEEYPFENLLRGKDDIDILCNDAAAFINAVGAIPLHHNYNRGNYYINISAYRIRMDIRFVGDGYYCREWEKKILKGRIFDERGFYVLNPEDYAFSLLYHALIQKSELSPVYDKKISAMFDKEKRNETEFLYELKEYMDQNHFYVEYPLDCAVYLNHANILRGNLAFKRDMRKELLRVRYRLHSRIAGLYTKIMN